MENQRRYSSGWRLAAGMLVLVLAAVASGGFPVAHARHGQSSKHLTPIQLEIEKQRQRLSSGDTEDRREAVTRLGSMHHPEASRAALSALRDPSPIVRATAAAAVLSLPAEESAAGLIALLADKDAFVRQHVAYALGQTRSRAAVASLIDRLGDKEESVRGSAAVALGQIADPAAVASLAAILHPQSGLAPAGKNKKSKREQNPFVLRAAARSLGQIGDRAAVPALISALEDEKGEADVRREAAAALGAIGDSSAIPALRGALTSLDPYLAEAAHEAIRKISRSQTSRGT